MGAGVVVAAEVHLAARRPALSRAAHQSYIMSVIGRPRRLRSDRAQLGGGERRRHAAAARVRRRRHRQRRRRRRRRLGSVWSAEAAAAAAAGFGDAAADAACGLSRRPPSATQPLSGADPERSRAARAAPFAREAARQGDARPGLTARHRTHRGAAPVRRRQLAGGAGGGATRRRDHRRRRRRQRGRPPPLPPPAASAAGLLRRLLELDARVKLPGSEMAIRSGDETARSTPAGDAAAGRSPCRTRSGRQSRRPRLEPPPLLCSSAGRAAASLLTPAEPVAAAPKALCRPLLELGRGRLGRRQRPVPNLRPRRQDRRRRDGHLLRRDVQMALRSVAELGGAGAEGGGAAEDAGAGGAQL